MSIWPDRKEEQIKELFELQRIEGSRMNQTDDRIKAHTSRMDSLTDQINALQETISVLKKASPPGVSDTVKMFEERVTALELWKVQIMGLLTEQTSAGRPRLTRTGKGLKAFYGK